MYRPCIHYHIGCFIQTLEALTFLLLFGARFVFLVTGLVSPMFSISLGFVFVLFARAVFGLSFHRFLDVILMLNGFSFLLFFLRSF
jgi:hypothetical protein